MVDASSPMSPRCLTGHAHPISWVLFQVLHIVNDTRQIKWVRKLLSNHFFDVLIPLSLATSLFALQYPQYFTLPNMFHRTPPGSAGLQPCHISSHVRTARVCWSPLEYKIESTRCYSSIVKDPPKLHVIPYISKSCAFQLDSNQCTGPCQIIFGE